MQFVDKMNGKVRAEFDRFISCISKMDGVLHIYLFGSYAYGKPTVQRGCMILFVNA